MNHAEHYGHLASLADSQRENARLLADAVAEASAGGLAWRQIGEALGVTPSAVFRQHKAGSPVSVLRAFNKPAEPEREAALAEVPAARAAAGRAQERLGQAVTFARALGCPQAAIGRAEAGDNDLHA